MTFSFEDWCKSAFKKNKHKEKKGKKYFCWHIEGHWRKEQDPLVKGMDRGTGSVPKCHGSGTLISGSAVWCDQYNIDTSDVQEKRLGHLQEKIRMSIVLADAPLCRSILWGLESQCLPPLPPCYCYKLSIWNNKQNFNYLKFFWCLS